MREGGGDWAGVIERGKKEREKKVLVLRHLRDRQEGARGGEGGVRVWGWWLRQQGERNRGDERKEKDRAKA